MLNKCMFIGYLGRDAEARYTASGESIVSFSIGVNEKWKKDGEQQEHTEWIQCSLWGKRGEKLAQYLTKGAHVYVEARLRTNTWKDKDGNERKATQFQIDDIQLLTARKQE